MTSPQTFAGDIFLERFGTRFPMKTAVIVQARGGSTRLPGKVLKPLADRPVLAHVLDRCRTIPGADAVVCATTDLPEDAAIEKIATDLGFPVFRGSESDVLARYHGAARMIDADIVMRVTSDCPLIDPVVCGAVLDLRSREGADYGCNNMPPSWPHGLDCEAFTMAALDEAFRMATAPHDREHVTPWIRGADHLKHVNLPRSGPSRHHMRWTLDYPEDFAFFTAVFEGAAVDGKLPGTEALIEYLDATPKVAQINQVRAQ